MTVTEAAAALEIDPRTVRAQIAAGRLEAEKRGRDWWVTPAAVKRYAATRKGRPGRPPKRATR